MINRCIGLIALLLFSVFAHASGNNSLTIRFTESGNYMIVLDDTKYSAQNVFQINGLKAGLVHVRVIKQMFNPYVEDMNRTELYNDVLEIKEGTKTTATLRRNGEFVINNVVPILEKESFDEHGSMDDGIDICSKSMSGRQFAQLKNVASKTNYSKGKLNVMKQAVRLHGVTTFQVKELMLMLPFERDRLALASYAYKYLQDSSTFFVVNNSFKYAETRIELQKNIIVQKQES